MIKFQKIFFILSISILLIFSSGKAFASDYFYDEFDGDTFDNSKWQVVANEGVVNVDSGYLNLSAGSTSTFPFVYSKTNPIPLSGNFEIEFKILYTKVTTKGSGLVFGTAIPINGSGDTPLSNPMFSNYFFIDAWQDSVLGFFNVFTGNCYNGPCNLSSILAYRKIVPPNLPDLSLHLIKFSYIDGFYKIYFDDVEKFTSNYITVRPTKVWMGNGSVQGTGDVWTNFGLDYIRIRTIPPSQKSPVVIIPGLGASWNPAILTGGEAPQSEWKIPWFVKHYDGLADTLVNAEYTKGQNLFTFAYDWRKPVDQTADVLKNYLETTVEPLNPGQKIDFVGHSLGGLVARAYSQKYGTEKIDKVVSVGSPHSGAIQSYLAWSGGEIHQDQPWIQLAFELLLQANKTGFMTDADVFRERVPSIRDILPTFDYLKTNVSPYPVIPLSSMKSVNRNFWLEGLNGGINSSFFDVFMAIIGNKGDTPEWYRVRKQNWWEKILDLWQNGKPILTEYSPGDLTVLSKSGKIDPDPFETVDNTNHTELVTTQQGIQKIIDVLGLTPSSIVTYPEFDLAPGLIFALLSPAKLHVSGPGGIFDSDANKLVLIPNALSGNYSVEVIGEGNGIYTLLVGQKAAEKIFWSKFMGEATPGSSEIYQFSFDMNNISQSPLSDSTGVEYLKAARAKLKTLPPSSKLQGGMGKIDDTISLIIAGKKAWTLVSFTPLLEKVFEYRKEKTGVNERNISFDALLDIQNAYVILANSLNMPALKDQAKALIDGASEMKRGTNGVLEVFSRFGKVTKSQALSFMNAESMLGQAKNSLEESDFNRAIILSQISIFLTKESLGK